MLSYVSSMGSYGYAMWARAGREIAAAFRAQPTPLVAFDALAAAGPACPTLHLYAQPRDDAYLDAQRDFAADHEWFTVRRLEAASHFPCLEAPEQVAAALDEFVAELP